MAGMSDDLMLQRLRRMFDICGVCGYADGVGVVCPFCPPEPDRVSCVHLGSAHRFGGGDYDAVNAYGLHVRGEVVAQEFWAECGHAWVVAFGFHKGATFVKLIQMPDRQEEGDE